jgi:hypothetical protein
MLLSKDSKIKMGKDFEEMGGKGEGGGQALKWKWKGTGPEMEGDSP